MKRLWAVLVVAVLVPGAVMVAGSSARSESPSGDTCTATGTGNTYRIGITIPSGTQQFGFAFGGNGAKITSVLIPGMNGSYSTQKLAPGTTGAWISDAPLTGAPVASLTTSGAVKGLTIVPSSASQSSYFDSVKCTMASAAGARGVAFTVVVPVTYDAAVGGWHLTVNIPTAGAVSARQLEPTTGGGSAKPVTSKSLVQTHMVTMKSGGKVTLTLKPTAAGADALMANGSIKAELHVTFDASDGRTAAKTVDLTLKK